MRETPRSQGTAGDARMEPPQPRLGRALAHTTGASGSGTPHRSDGRPPQTPRGARQTGPAGRLGTTPPVPRRPASLLSAWLPALYAVVFAVITWQVAADGPLRSLDERVELRIVGRGPWTLTGLLADLGSMGVALPVLGAAIAYAVCRGRRAEALYAALAMAAVPALVAPLKTLIDRQGPLTGATGFYPSGHTATAMVAYCGAAMLITPYLRRGWAMPVAVALTLATSIGLVLRGYHWPLDVIGSWCLCGLLLTVSSIRTRRSSSKTPTG
ncbi:phosphatase PAP2 family protein [Streptomyces sp. ISL-1]|uniref:phosphatase PAP2 family protein n=1 Tax=Streptomyces sp. ISL-1 TaxID=2817657 RepID=UPI001BE87DFF|nr:phosphatase PAP2 family protein [Streptomyces sp. ISL-1]MBT2393035.1 phosphatase PAP2 family protein [Streptomyces sp. ISL-1]